MRPFSIGAALVFAVTLSACSAGGSSTSSIPLSTLPQAPSTTQIANVQSGGHRISALAEQIAAGVTNFKYREFPRPGSHKAPAIASATATVSYPMDLRNHGGPTLKTATEHNVYLTIVRTPGTAATPAPASYWGNPDAFLTNANAEMATPHSRLHVTDQYVISNAANRYPHGSDWSIVEYVAPDTAGTVVLNEGQIISAAVDAGINLGSGFGLSQEYHVFLQKGVDQCFDQAADCYSPDNPAAWTFCAWHGSADLGGTYGSLIFSVEPWQGATGSGNGSCGSSGTPAALQNSTASTFSHELIESITDPELSAWWNNEFGTEIADECVAFNAPYVLNGTTYVLQKEYSNARHGCI